MEIWKQIKGYEIIYKISNNGTVERVGGSVTRLNHFLYVPAKVMLPKDNGKGYLRIKLTKNGKEKRVMLHRLIAESFIPNPENKPQVNHINGIKTDNKIENLEWVTHLENIRHSIKIGTFHKNHPNKKKLNN